MSSRFILMAGIASLCIGLTGPSFAAGAEAELTAAATGVQQVAMANDAKEKPAKKKKKSASNAGAAKKVALNRYNIDPRYQAQTVSFTGKQHAPYE